MEALGFDLKYFLFQLANFVILFLILRKLLHKPLTDLLEKRRLEIAGGLENAEKMKVALAETESRQEEILEEARKKARAFIEETKVQAKELELHLSNEASEKAAQILARTQEELQTEREEFRRQLRNEMTDLVLQATEKVLEGAISTKEKQQHIEKLVKDLA